jgi:glycosyltransferase involved in cell wall biosynthesis
MLVRELRALRPHIVHTYDSKPSALGRLAAWIAGVPVIIGTLPGMGSLYVDERAVTRLSRVIYETVQRVASRMADLTVLQNQDDLNDFLARRVLVSSKAMLLSGGSGVDTERFRPQRLTPSDVIRRRATLGVNDGTLVVTMVARIIRSKGALEYAAAANRIRREFQQVRFLLVGADDHGSRDSLNEAERLAVAQGVDCLGHQADVADVLAITDVFVLPSFYMEGMPRALLEAAASGLPIITTDIRGCRDVIEDGVSGILIPPRDAEALATAVLGLLRDPVRRSRLGHQARVRAVNDFDVSAVAGRLLSVYLGQLRRLTDFRNLAGA